MSISLKMGQLVNSEKALVNLAQQKFRASFSLRLKKAIKAISEKLAPYNEVHQEKVKQYGEQDGDKVEVKGENMKAFMAEMEVVFAEDVSLDIDKIIISELPEEDKKSFFDAEISSNDLAILDWLIEA